MINYDEKYYEKVISENGYVPCGDLTSMIEAFSPEDMRWWLCAYNLGPEIANDISVDNTFVTTGVAINHEPHMGTVAQILRAIYFQDRGYDTQIVLGDLDSRNQRSSSNQVVNANFQRYQKFVHALGFDGRGGSLRGQYDHPEVMETAFMISPYVTDQDFAELEEDIFGYYREKGIYDGMNFATKLAILLMFADFLDQGYIGGYKHIIVLSGIDEHLYVPKADEIAKRMGLDVTVSGLFTDVIKGLNGEPKMSKSLPGSGIWANMSETEIRKAIFDIPDDYTDYNDSIVYQLMYNIMDPECYGRYLDVLKKRCNEKDIAWNIAKLDFVKYLSGNICCY